MGSITNFTENKSYFTLCNHGNEVLHIRYSHDLNSIDMGIYQNYTRFRFKLLLWHRILWCFRILWNKTAYSDQITLDKSKIIELKTFLNSLDLD